MFLCLCTTMWADRPLSDALAAAAATEIRALELSAVPPNPHIDPRRLRPEDQALLEGWKVAALRADHPDLPRAEEEGGDAAVEWTIAAVRTARALGAGVVATALGRTEIDPWEAAWNRATSALRAILHETRRTGVRLAVELHAEDVLDSLRKARRLLTEIEEPRLGLTLDIGVLHYLRIPLREALAVAGDRLHHVRISDATRRDFGRALGTGEVSIPAALRALREHGYEGALSLALRNPESVEESVARLQESLVERTR